MNPYQHELDWFGLYSGDTSRDDLLFSRRSVAHPAKGSIPLFNRILDEMERFGWLAPGACVLDPFGGRGTTALLWTARHPENRAVTVEIEPHFVAMQRENKAHAERKLGRSLPWEIVEGDARRLDTLVREAGCCVGSPPFAEVVATADPNFLTPGERGKRFPSKSNLPSYGTHPAQIGNLRDPDPAPGVCVTSPPFEAQSGGPGWSEKLTGPLSDPALHARHAASKINAQAGYGPQAAVGSPPFEDSLTESAGVDTEQRRAAAATLRTRQETISPIDIRDRVNGHTTQKTYAENGAGQIGAMQQETYAEACGAVYKALARAGVRYVALVVKNPTRNGKLRRLDKLTCRLLRAAGYRVVAWRRAWLFEDADRQHARRGQASLFADEVPASGKRVGRLSFFRRLHLSKGGVAAQWEDVFFAELVEPGGDGCAVSSPPYGETQVAALDGSQGDGFKRGRSSSSKRLQADGLVGYGTHPAQIGNLKDTE